MSRNKAQQQSQKEDGRRKRQRYSGARDSWDAPGITELGNLRFSVNVGDEEVIHDCTSLSRLFSVFAAAATKFAVELDMEPESFIATAVHSLVWTTPNLQRHHVYTQIAGQAGYVERTKYPRYLKNAIRATWCSPEEEFSSDTESDSTKIIMLSDSDTE